MKRTPLYGFAKIFAQWPIRFFVRYKAVNSENIPKAGKIIVCCNHVSLTDPIRLAFTQHRQIYFMSKAELFRNLFLKILLTSLGAFPVQRGKGDKDALNVAGQLLQQGKALGIFIEGTRSKTGDLLQPKAGAVMLAHHYQAPLIPACITAKGGKPPRLFRKCFVSFGKPVTPEELGVVNGSVSEYRAASQELMRRIAALRESDLKRFD